MEVSATLCTLWLGKDLTFLLVAELVVVWLLANGVDMAPRPETSQADAVLWRISVNCQSSCDTVQLPRHAGQPVVEIQCCEYYRV